MVQGEVVLLAATRLNHPEKHFEGFGKMANLDDSTEFSFAMNPFSAKK